MTDTKGPGDGGGVKRCRIDGACDKDGALPGLDLCHYHAPRKVVHAALAEAKAEIEGWKASCEASNEARDNFAEMANRERGRAEVAEAREDELRQIVGRLAIALIAGGVPREDVEVITGAALRSPESRPEGASE